ncbi:MAG: AAA family ATPase [Planctomycetes bacterium]|nr:AAA family ATPase [Planctomycetota bacterium]
MKTIAVVNQKGGCGKTTVSINLASALADAGHKVLLVDMDPQSHCAVGLAVPEEQIEQSIYDVLISKSRNEPIRLSEILWQISDRLELAPASLDLSAFEQQMAGIPDRESCLRNVLDDAQAHYDFTVIDCPPAVGLLTFNALRSATDVVVPVETGYFALHGLSKQLETLSILCKRCRQQVEVRVLASMYDIRTKMAREILAELRTHFSDRMLKTVVNFNTKIKEAASFGQPINEYDPASKGQQDFQMLAEELAGASLKQESKHIVDSLADQLEAISTTATELLQSGQKDAEPQIEIVSVPAATEKVEVTEVVTRSSMSPPAASPKRTPEAEKKQTPSLDSQNTDAKSGPLDIDAKLSQFYGANQTTDSIVFVSLYPRAHDVKIAGDFNNWQPEKTPMERVGNSGEWRTKVSLANGRYRYRLVVDGQWQQDPYNDNMELNPFGDYNSILEVV